MTCETFREQLPFLICGEVTFEEEEALEQHLLVCQECREERDRMASVLVLAADASEPVSDALLSRCRQDLRLRLAEEAAAAPVAAWWHRLIPSFPLSSLWKPAGAVGLLAIGFFCGRLAPGGGSIQQIAHTRTESVPVARLRYVSPDASGRVQLVVDETRQREFTGDLGDESVRRLLLTALEDPSDPGLRAETIDLLKQRPEDEEIRQALVRALRNDANAAVRLKAIDGLRAHLGEPETREVLCEALLSDDNEAIRAQAIDLLMQHEQAGMAGVLQELLRRESNGYVRSRSLKALGEMRASAGTF